MADRFGAGARGVEIRGAGGGKDGEGRRGVAFGRDVDVGAVGRGGGGEEEGLLEGPGSEVGGDGGVERRHFLGIVVAGFFWGGEGGMEDGGDRWEEIG